MLHEICQCVVFTIPVVLDVVCFIGELSNVFVNCLGVAAVYVMFFCVFWQIIYFLVHDVYFVLFERISF